DGFGAPEESLAQQERGERAAAASRERSVARNARVEEIEVCAAGDILLAEAVRILILMLESELERVRAADVAQIILQAPTGLIGTVVGGGAPGGKFREVNRGEVLVAIDDVFNADFVLPVLVH